VTKDEILEHLRNHVATWWVPDEVVFLPELPLTGTGKINKVRLREQLNAGGDLTARR
jgi:fatty-acyl-CoA synthase